MEGRKNSGTADLGTRRSGDDQGCRRGRARTSERITFWFQGEYERPGARMLLIAIVGQVGGRETNASGCHAGRGEESDRDLGAGL